MILRLFILLGCKSKLKNIPPVLSSRNFNQMSSSATSSAAAAAAPVSDAEAPSAKALSDLKTTLEAALNVVPKFGTFAELQALLSLLQKPANQLKSQIESKKLEESCLAMAGPLGQYLRCTATSFARSDYHCNCSSNWELLPKAAGAKPFNIELVYYGETSGEGSYSVTLPGGTYICVEDPEELVQRVPPTCVNSIAKGLDCSEEEVESFLSTLFDWSGGWPNFKQ